MSDKMREEFEMWASGKGLILSKATSGNQFYYLFEDTDYAWEAWQAARTVPEGFVMVPVEPTLEMQAAGAQSIRFDTTTINKLWTGNKVYRAMLSAAQEPKK